MMLASLACGVAETYFDTAGISLACQLTKLYHLLLVLASLIADAAHLAP